MKKNISKPETDINDLSAALSICDMIYMKLNVCMQIIKASRKDHKSIKKMHDLQRKYFYKRDWVNGLSELRDEKYRKIYRSELKKLLETDRKEMKKSCDKLNEAHGTNKDISEIIGGLLGTKKMYEYLTGENLDGKKIHEGYFDNDNEE